MKKRNSKKLIEWYEYLEKHIYPKTITLQRWDMDWDHYFILRIDKNDHKLILCDMNVNDFEFSQYVPSYDELTSSGWLKIEEEEEENEVK